MMIGQRPSREESPQPQGQIPQSPDRFDDHRVRALLGARAQLVGMTTRLSNHIRGVLKTFGLLPDTMRGLRFDWKVEALNV